MTRIAAARGLVKEGDLFEFFHERVETAAAHQRAPVSANTVFYLSNILAEMGRTDESAEETTLVEMQQRAASAPRAEAVTIWKRLGDQSLIVTGYFREQLERRQISRDYYARMGSTAYHVLGRMMGAPQGGGLGEIFTELSARYDACAEVIAEVRDESRECTDTDVLKLYEEWLVTGSPRVAERLRQLGLVPARAGGSG